MGLNFGIGDYKNGYTIIHLVALGILLTVVTVCGTQVADDAEYASNERYKRQASDATTTPKAPEKKLNPIIIIAPAILGGIPLLLILFCVIRAFCCKKQTEPNKAELVTNVQVLKTNKH